VGSGEILIVLLCLIGLAVATALVLGVIFLIVRRTNRGRDAEKRLQLVEAELRELKKKLPSMPSPGPEEPPKQSGD
jgi:hypothetical protein